MSQAAVGLISKALPTVDNSEDILKIKNLITLFMQTMNVWQPMTLSIIVYGFLILLLLLVIFGRPIREIPLNIV